MQIYTKPKLEKMTKNDIINSFLAFQKQHGDSSADLDAKNKEILDLENKNKDLTTQLVKVNNDLKTLQEQTEKSKEVKVIITDIGPQACRLYSSSFVNNYLGLREKGGQSYARCSVDYYLNKDLLTIKGNYRNHNGIMDTFPEAFSYTYQVTNEDKISITQGGFEEFVKNKFGYIEVLPNMNAKPFIYKF